MAKIDIATMSSTIDGPASSSRRWRSARIRDRHQPGVGVSGPKSRTDQSQQDCRHGSSGHESMQRSLLIPADA